jgi:hypothetical protein
VHRRKTHALNATTARHVCHGLAYDGQLVQMLVPVEVRDAHSSRGNARDLRCDFGLNLRKAQPARKRPQEQSALAAEISARIHQTRRASQRSAFTQREVHAEAHPIAHRTGARQRKFRRRHIRHDTGTSDQSCVDAFADAECYLLGLTEVICMNNKGVRVQVIELPLAVT